jgi:hypothetical protein
VQDAGDRIARQRQLADDLADAAQPALGRLVNEGRHLRRVAGDQEVALAALGELADLAAIVIGVGDDVAIFAEDRLDLLQEHDAASLDAGDVLEQDDGDRVVLIGFQQQPDAANGEAVQRLIFEGERLLGRQQAGEALARRRQESEIDVGAVAPADLLGGDRFPPGRRRAAVEIAILLFVEQVRAPARGAGERLEIGERAGIVVDAADAFEAAGDVADARIGIVEAGRARTHAAEEMDVAEDERVACDLAEGIGHERFPFAAAARPITSCSLIQTSHSDSRASSSSSIAATSSGSAPWPMTSARCHSRRPSCQSAPAGSGSSV